MLRRLLVLAVLLLLVAVPLLTRPTAESAPRDARRLIVITPHNEQIRAEFARGFDRWHTERFGEPVAVVYSTPGGTSEIRRMLQAQYRSDLRSGRPVGGSADLVWGGGSYEFGVLKQPIEVEVPAAGGGTETLATTVIEPIPFATPFLHEVYGEENRIGDDPLFDPDQYWFGTALSGFGIVFNRDVLHALGVDEPTGWADLADPRLRTWVGLVNPGQSGSITTAFEAVLLRRGWVDGWRILRRAAANSRSFSASSTKVPVEVSLGDAAAGICIDFYGRYQAQAIADAGGGDRVGYIDPPGETRIDADPIAMLRGAPDPELARRFVEFALSVDGQALWQLPPRQPDGVGPDRFALRRMPIRRGLYTSPLFTRFVDQVQPYSIASRVEVADRNVRSFIAPLFAAMAIDNHEALVEAWNAIVTHPAYPEGGGVVTAAMVDDPVLRTMLELFDAMPTVEGPDGAALSLDDTTELNAIRAGWLKGEWAEKGLWPAQSTPIDEMQRRFDRFFRDRYEQVVAHQPR